MAVHSGVRNRAKLSYRKYLEALLEAHDNNISAAARAAGIERMSIYKMIRRLSLDKTEARDDADGADDTGR